MFFECKELLSIFNARKVKYLIVGGYAVSLHAQPRTTKDIDILIQPDSHSRLSLGPDWWVAHPFALTSGFKMKGWVPHPCRLPLATGWARRSGSSLATSRPFSGAFRLFRRSAHAHRVCTLYTTSLFTTKFMTLGS